MMKLKTKYFKKTWKKTFNSGKLKKTGKKRKKNYSAWRIISLRALALICLRKKFYFLKTLRVFCFHFSKKKKFVIFVFYFYWFLNF